MGMMSCEKIQMGRGTVALGNIAVITAFQTQGLSTLSDGQSCQISRFYRFLQADSSALPPLPGSVLL